MSGRETYVFYDFYGIIPKGNMSMKKYFFFDIDGTLTFPLTAIVPESTKKALRLLQENGNFVAIATGRIQADACKMAATLGIRSIVSDGGNGVTVGGKILWQRGLPSDRCCSVLDSLDPGKYPLAVTTENRMMRISPDSRYQTAETDHYYETIVDPQFDYRREPVIRKIYILCSEKEEPAINLHGLPHVRFGRDTLLIEPTDKAKGIREVMNHFGISDTDVVVFGDGTNDLTMFRPEWMTVAMGNARPVIKARAQYVTESVGHDGVWNACRRFGWI